MKIKTVVIVLATLFVSNTFAQRLGTEEKENVFTQNISPLNPRAASSDEDTRSVVNFRAAETWDTSFRSGSTEIDVMRAIGEPGNNAGNELGEFIDENSRRLTLNVTDYTLKGNAGMAFPISRTRRETFWPARILMHKYDRQLMDTMSDWRLDIPHIKITRTSQSAFRIFRFDGSVDAAATASFPGVCAYAGPSNYWGNPPGSPAMDWRAPVLAGMPGSQGIPMFYPQRTTMPNEPLLQGSDYVTHGNWKFKCATSQYNSAKLSKFIGYAPDGSVYEFDEPSLGSQDTSLGTNSGPSSFYNKYPSYLRIFVTKITDRNGNWIKFDYKAINDQNGQLIAPEMRDWAYVETISTSDGKSIALNWQLNPVCRGSSACPQPLGPGELEKYFFPSYLLESFSAANKTWNYKYQGSNFELTAAEMPNGDSWKYAFSSPNTSLQIIGYTVTQPKGATRAYRMWRRIVNNSANTNYTLDSVEAKVYSDAIGKSFSELACFENRFVQGTRGILNVEFGSCEQANPYALTSCYSAINNRSVHREFYEGITEDEDAIPHASFLNNLKANESIFSGNVIPVVNNNAQCPILAPGTSFNRTPVKKTTYLWGKILAPLAQFQIPGVTLYGDFYYQDFDRFRRVLSQKRTEISNWGLYDVRQTEFDVFGQTALAAESRNGGNGVLDRVTDTTYKNLSPISPTGPGQWVIGQPEVVLTGENGVVLSNVTNTFDKKGQLLSSNSNGVTKSYTYTAAGDVETATDERNKVTSYSNHKSGIAQSTTLPGGDSESKVVDAEGRIEQITNARGFIVNIEFDELGRAKKVTHPIGLDSNIVWTSNGRTKTTTRGNFKEVLELDGFGRVVSETTLDVTRPSEARVKRTAYDGFGHIRFESDIAASATTRGVEFVYDAQGRMIESKKTADGATTRYSYEANETKRVVDPMNNQRTSTYRGYGGASEEILTGMRAGYTKQLAAGNTVLDEVETTYNRDPLGAAKTMTQDGLVRSFKIDTKRMVTAEFLPELGAAQIAGGYNLSYCRDNAGLLIGKSINAECTSPATANLLSNTFDARGRLSLTNFADANTPDVSYSYDPNNNQTNSTRAGVSNVRTYTAADKLETDTYEIDTYRFKFNRRYDDQLVVLTDLVYPSGKIYSHTIDALGRVRAVSGLASNISYWPSGMVNQMTLSNGTTQAFTQNSKEQIQSISASKGAQQLFNQNFTYDRNGNNLTITDPLDAANSSVFKYDELNRLISTTYPSAFSGQEFRRGYDDRGNVQFERQPERQLDFTYDAITNRMTSFSGSASGSLNYDNLGNMVSDGQRVFAFDKSSSLVSSTAPVAKQFVYDGNMRIIRESKSGRNRYMLYSGDNLVMEFDPTEKSYTEHVYVGPIIIASRKVINADQVDSDADGKSDILEFTNPD